MRPAPRLLVIAVTLALLSVVALVLFSVPLQVVTLVWAGLVTISLVDLALSTPARSITLEADLPTHGFVGKTVNLSLRLTARHLPPGMRLRLTHDEGLQSPLEFPTNPDLPLTLTERGIHRITRLSALYPSRIALFEIVANWPLALSVAALPDVSPILSGAIRTQVLPLLEGMHAMNRRGEGSDFHQLRDFVPGMDRRSIDWKRSARLRRLVSRETRAERNHQIIMCLDTGHLMAERLGSLSKLDHAIHAALALTWAGALAGDNVGFYSFGPRPHRFLPPAAGRSAFGPIRATSAELEQETAETNHTLGLSTLNARLKRRSLVIVFSDFADSITAELLVENLAVMQRHHLILYVALRDPAVQALSRPKALSMTAVASAIASRQMAHDRRIVFDRLTRLGVLCLDTTPEDLSPALISRYMDIKAREMV